MNKFAAFGLEVSREKYEQFDWFWIRWVSIRILNIKHRLIENMNEFMHKQLRTFQSPWHPWTNPIEAQKCETTQQKKKRVSLILPLTSTKQENRKHKTFFFILTIETKNLLKLTLEKSEHDAFGLFKKA